MATNFQVLGPLEVPIYPGNAYRIVTDESARDFWLAHPELGKKRGCYVFGIRAGKGLTPGYVGKACKSFKQEVFGHHKLTRYQQFMADYKKGTPVLFLIVAPLKQGVPNARHIGELEEFLIQTALAANPELMNIKGTKAEEWSISGCFRSGQGKPSAAARDFRKLMKF